MWVYLYSLFVEVFSLAWTYRFECQLEMWLFVCWRWFCRRPKRTWIGSLQAGMCLCSAACVGVRSIYRYQLDFIWAKIALRLHVVLWRGKDSEVFACVCARGTDCSKVSVLSDGQLSYAWPPHSAFELIRYLGYSSRCPLFEAPKRDRLLEAVQNCVQNSSEVWSWWNPSLLKVLISRTPMGTQQGIEGWLVSRALETGMNADISSVCLESKLLSFLKALFRLHAGNSFCPILFIDFK